VEALRSTLGSIEAIINADATDDVYEPSRANEGSQFKHIYRSKVTSDVPDDDE
jgi:hypothetical protein